MDHIKAYHISQGLAVAAVILALALCLFREINGVFWLIAALSGGLLLAAGVILLRFFRCPHCGRLLPSRSGLTDFCPHCGERLQ